MWHTYSIKETEKKLKTSVNFGLSTKEVEKRKKEYGENVITEKKKESFFSKFISQFKDFMIIILLIAALISGVLSFIQNTNDYTDSIIIVSIVIFNAIIGVLQESKAEKMVDALKKISSPTCKVKRNGKISTLQTKDLVPGDIILIENGNIVPADCRIISTSNFKVDESALTGETTQIEKDSDVILQEKIPLGDMQNMAFSSTITVSGHAEAIVVATGMNTNVGKIANMLMEDNRTLTPLQLKLADVGKKLGLLCIFICIIIFFIGCLKKISVTDMFMMSISLAVAAIPEGLPAIVTIMLSFGITKMAKKNAIIRKLPAVETLGSSMVICSDKTGTLTKNEMEVILVYDSNGKLESGFNMNTYKFCLKLGSICNNSIVENTNSFKEKNIIGEPTELAITKAAIKYGAYEKCERLFEIPFDSKRKMMSTINILNNKKMLIVKGAPDFLINKCNRYYSNDNILDMSSSKKSEILGYNETMSKNALRVIAVAYKEISSVPNTNKYNANDIESNLIFVGLIGMIDPPRENVEKSILECKRAGIKPVMITGDHVITAKAIAKKIGIFNDDDLAISGKELDLLSDKDLVKNISKYSVFARVSPEHKVRIVKAFKKNQKVVAMTGDGINDAPALKAADIGIAMGKNGTDVAKNASDMILTDDNFVTIVEAVKEGRHIYDNIKKAVHFLLATNIGEIFTILLGLIFSINMPLLAIHLLFINLITDSLPAIALGLEPIEKNIMRKKPIPKNKSIFADGMIFSIFIEGLLIGLLTIVTFNISVKLYTLEVARTMTFITLSFLELFHSFNIRSKESIFKIGIFRNKYLILSFILGILLQTTIVIIPTFANLFKIVPLNLTQWFTCIIISIIPIILFEIKKKMSELKNGVVIS